MKLTIKQKRKLLSIYKKYNYNHYCDETYCTLNNINMQYECELCAENPLNEDGHRTIEEIEYEANSLIDSFLLKEKDKIEKVFYKSNYLLISNETGTQIYYCPLKDDFITIKR